MPWLGTPSEQQPISTLVATISEFRRDDAATICPMWFESGATRGPRRSNQSHPAGPYCLLDSVIAQERTSFAAAHHNRKKDRDYQENVTMSPILSPVPEGASS